MAIRQMRYRDDEVLRKKSKKVEKFDDRLRVLIEDMKETLKAQNGIGLAAPQVGILKQVVIIDMGEEAYELVNPEIIEESGSQICAEGCLSFPQKFGEVERPQKVTIKAQDRHGKEFTLTGEDLLARAFCHEIDHLNGVLFIDKVIKFINPDE